MGGALEYTQCGLLGVLTNLKVYYNPQSIANLLSMSVVTSKYNVTMDKGVDSQSLYTWKIIKKLNSIVAAMDSINFMPPTISPWRHLKIISPTIKKLINIKAPLSATNLSPLFPPIKNIYPVRNLKSR